MPQADGARPHERRASADWEFRLPTEAQWEYACRAGTTTATSFGDTLSSKQANFKASRTTAARRAVAEARCTGGQLSGQPVGLHDMHGNTFEWCRDWYHPHLPGGTDPDLYRGKPRNEASMATSRACAAAAAGQTMAGPAGRRFACDSNRNAATTTSAFVSW